MSANDWQIAARPTALFVAIILGSALAICGCWISVKRQNAGLRGILLCAIGLIFLGLSIWQSIDIIIGVFHIQARIAEAEKATQDVKREIQAGNNEEAQKAAENAAKATSSASDQMREVFGFH